MDGEGAGAMCGAGERRGGPTQCRTREWLGKDKRGYRLQKDKRNYFQFFKVFKIPN